MLEGGREVNRTGRTTGAIIVVKQGVAAIRSERIFADSLCLPSSVNREGMQSS